MKSSSGNIHSLWKINGCSSPLSIKHTIVRIIGLKQEGGELFLKDFHKY